jgi:hydroxymethylbilane synthase
MMPSSISGSPFFLLKIAARSSLLSKAQAKEVEELLHLFHPEVVFEPCFIDSYGDKDQQTSLRSLDKTDFFTKEIDALVLSGACRAAIHSAKDLPEPLPKGIILAAITQGLTPADSLVMREGNTLGSLPSGARIATSSVRREEAVKQLRADLSFMDLRGPVDQRLAKLNAYEADGIVVAEAALIRLGLIHLNRITLPGETHPFQGRLAITARAEDLEIQELFSCLECVDLSRNTKAVTSPALQNYNCKIFRR